MEFLNGRIAMTPSRTGAGGTSARASVETDDPIDWEYVTSLVRGPLTDITDHYFRGEVRGAEKLPDPDEGPCIVAPNHSGNAFPHDAIILDALLWRESGFTKAGKFRSVYTPTLASTWWMRPFAIDDWWRRVGGVDMTFDNFDALLRRGDRVIYYPEGVPGIGKGFLRRYQLQPFHSSFVVLAARHDVPVYPVSAVNAEWVNPISLTFESVNDWAKRWLGVPFLPLPIAPLAFVLPFVFYLAFPCQMTFVVQDPVDVRDLLRRNGADDPADPGREEARRAADQIQTRAQADLDQAVARHGQTPYDWKDLGRSLWEIRGRMLRSTPLGWPLHYVQHERDLRSGPAPTRLHGVLRDLDLGAWYLPFGWFLIAALRAFRAPPYGHFGLSEPDRRQREGARRWSLADEPLPSREELAAAEPVAPPDA
jgi:1-acyl-sn-glycerol-3-phosphate acyltransferase